MRRAGKAMGIVLCFVIIAAGLLYFVLSSETKEPVIAVNSGNTYITPIGESMVSAHRSGGGIFPENTLLAFECCLNSDTFATDFFEFDVHLTGDDVLIVLHDGTLDRTSDAVEHFGKKNINPVDYTYDELRELNMGETYVDSKGEMPYKGLRGDEIPDNLRIVSVEDVFDYLESHGRYFYSIDIKDKGEVGKRATDILHSVLVEKGLLSQVIAASFNGDINKYQNEKYPDMIRSAGITEVLKFYFYSLLGINAGEDAFKFDALQVPADQYIINLATTRFINYAHKYDIAVQYWTINDENKMKELNDKGADAIITDFPNVAYDLIHSKLPK